MSGLAEFLLARIAEDEARAEAIEDGQYALIDEYPADQQILWLSERMLRECKAKRRVVEYVVSVADQVDGEWGCGHSADAIRSEQVGRSSCYGVEELRAGLSPLAEVYSDHPDYREEWRPKEWVR